MTASVQRASLRRSSSKQRLAADVVDARPLLAGVLLVRVGAHGGFHFQQLQAHGERPRFAVEHARKHTHRSRRDRTVAVAGPRMTTTRAANHHVAAVTARFGQPRQKMTRSHQVRQHGFVKGVAKLRGGLIEQTAALVAAAQRQRSLPANGRFNFCKCGHGAHRRMRHRTPRPPGSAVAPSGTCGAGPARASASRATATTGQDASTAARTTPRPIVPVAPRIRTAGFIVPLPEHLLPRAG